MVPSEPCGSQVMMGRPVVPATPTPGLGTSAKAYGSSTVPSAVTLPRMTRRPSAAVRVLVRLLMLAPKSRSMIGPNSSGRLADRRTAWMSSLTMGSAT